jgi:hypothetical protein
MAHGYAEHKNMVASALVVDGIFSAAGLVPSVHPKRS